MPKRTRKGTQHQVRRSSRKKGGPHIICQIFAWAEWEWEQGTTLFEGWERLQIK